MAPLRQRRDGRLTHVNEALTEYEWEGRRGTGISEYLVQMPARRPLRRGRAQWRRDRDETDIHRRPAELLRDLIRFDTTNPPGNERECIAYIDGLLTRGRDRDARSARATPSGRT